MSHDPLVTLALLGTARMTAPPPPPAPDLTELWRAIPLADPAAAVLHALALDQACRRAGTRSTEASAAPEPCPPETQPELPPHAVAALLRMLGGEFAEALPEWLRLVARSAAIVPARHLPELLAAGARDHALRADFAKLAGERGRWLARRQPPFAWLLEEGRVCDEAWDEPHPALRLAWLRQTRAADPARAAACIDASWPGESAEFRERLAILAAAAPDPADEGWLQRHALADRRHETRRAAAAALAQLPGCPYARRACDRLAGCLRVERKIFRRTLAVSPPATFDPAWAADGLREKPPQGSGEKAWWLRQIAAVVPLDAWPDLLDCTPAELFALPLDADWREALLLGWIDSARAMPARALSEFLLPFLAALDPWPAAAGPRPQTLAGVLAAMQEPRRCATLEALLPRLPACETIHILTILATPPPPGQGASVLARVREALAAKPNLLTRPEARALALGIPRERIGEQLRFLASLPELAPAAEEFATMLEFRRDLVPDSPPTLRP